MGLYPLSMTMAKSNNIEIQRYFEIHVIVKET